MTQERNESQGTSEVRSPQISITIEENLKEHQTLMGSILNAMLSSNKDLGEILNSNNKVVSRQNVLISLFGVAIALMSIQIGLGLSMQRLQESAKTQLSLERDAREQAQRELALVLTEVKSQVSQLDEISARTKTIPTITSNNGQLKLEIPLDEEAQKQAAKKLSTGKGLDKTGPTPDRVSIPLRPTQSSYSEK